MSSENREIAFGLFLVYVISFFYLIIIQHFHFSLVFLFSCNRPTIIMKSLKEIDTENVKDDSNLGRRSSIDLAGVVARILVGNFANVQWCTDDRYAIVAHQFDIFCWDQSGFFFPYSNVVT